MTTATTSLEQCVYQERLPTTGEYYRHNETGEIYLCVFYSNQFISLSTGVYAAGAQDWKPDEYTRIQENETISIKVG